MYQEADIGPIVVSHKDTIKNNKFMNPNMSLPDRIVRIALALLVAYLYYAGVITGTLGIVLLVGAAIFLLTSLINYCPLYSVLGLRRWEKRRDAAGDAGK